MQKSKPFGSLLYRQVSPVDSVFERVQQTRQISDSDRQILLELTSSQYELSSDDIQKVSQIFRSLQSGQLKVV